MEKETLIELAKQLRNDYVNPNDLQKVLAMDSFERGEVSGALMLIEAIERLVECE